MIKIIIFDLDDTLIESRKNYIATCVKAAEVLGIRVPTEEDFIWYGDSWHDFIRQTWPDIDPEAFDRVYTDLARQIVYNRFKGVNTTLNLLRKNYDLYILTKRSRTFLDLRLAQSGIDMTAIKKIFTSSISVAISVAVSVSVTRDAVSGPVSRVAAGSHASPCGSIAGRGGTRRGGTWCGGTWCGGTRCGGTRCQRAASPRRCPVVSSSTGPRRRVT